MDIRRRVDGQTYFTHCIHNIIAEEPKKQKTKEKRKTNSTSHKELGGSVLDMVASGSKELLEESKAVSRSNKGRNLL